MRRVALATANRAERGILDPVIKKLQARKDIEFELWEAPFFTSETLNRGSSRPFPDVVLVPADRQEMVPVAQFLYYNWRVPIFHLWAGAPYTGTWDDLNRRVLSTFAYLMFCEDRGSRHRLIASGEEPWRCIVTGTPHFDDMKTRTSYVPKKPYDLVLLEPNPINRQDERDTVTRTLGMVDVRRTNVWIGPADPFEELVIPPWVQYHPNLPRNEFLGLLKHCRRFISNSSVAVYEAPYFGTKVINPGKRNKGRKYGGSLKPGAADRIVDLLANFPLDKAKLLKPYGRKP